jgi:hypothetical protein
VVVVGGGPAATHPAKPTAASGSNIEQRMSNFLVTLQSERIAA